MCGETQDQVIAVRNSRQIVYGKSMIIHVDMDAFFASVEERERPELVAHPVIVGGQPGKRGVVCAANYHARKFGVHSAMPTAQALRLCPDAVLLAPRMALYSEVSHQIRSIFERYTPVIEPLSLDEAFLDVSASQRLHGNVREIAKKIKRDIKNELKLVASVGVAPNMFVAKIASDLDKPDGFVVVDDENKQAFLDPLPVSRLWGVGKVTLGLFNKMGVYKIRDVRALSPQTLQQHFGKHGLRLSELARGVDKRRVTSEHQAKSISNEITFAVDLDDKRALKMHLLQLTEQVAWRLRRKNLSGRTVRLKVRLSDFSTYSRSITLMETVQGTQIIWKAISGLFDKFLSEKNLPIRLLGVGVSGFDDLTRQQNLFSEDALARQEIDKVTDEINERFGSAVVRRGSVTCIS